LATDHERACLELSQGVRATKSPRPYCPHVVNQIEIAKLPLWSAGEGENMNVRASLLVPICVLALNAAQAEQARTFQASVDALTAPQRDTMKGQSWSEGCPVPLDDLVSIHLNYVGFDDAVHDGVLVVHRRLAKETVEIFGELFAAGFPIERMQPYEDFPVGEYAAHNDTVGFYCRPAQDNPKDFSSHAYGIAIDINSMTNPYHDPGGWWPVGSNGDRNRSTPGLLAAESEAVKIFIGTAGFGVTCSPRQITCTSARLLWATKTILCGDPFGQANCNLRRSDSFVARYIDEIRTIARIVGRSNGGRRACNDVIF
jgi:hypothetical protein